MVARGFVAWGQIEVTAELEREEDQLILEGFWHAYIRRGERGFLNSPVSNPWTFCPLKPTFGSDGTQQDWRRARRMLIASVWSGLPWGQPTWLGFELSSKQPDGPITNE